jgi:hypothetical protein
MTVPKRFDFLRFISALLKVFAWIVLILSILGAISTALFSTQMGSLLGDQLGEYGWLFGGVGAILSAIFVLFFGFLYFALLFALGESIALNLAVEENTRMTAALLLKMQQDSQVDARATYPGGFTSEPEPFK